MGTDYDAVRGIAEKDLLSRRNDKVRVNKINKYFSNKTKNSHR